MCNILILRIYPGIVRTLDIGQAPNKSPGPGLAWTGIGRGEIENDGNGDPKFPK